MSSYELIMTLVRKPASQATSTDTLDAPDPAALMQPGTNRPTRAGQPHRIALLTNLVHRITTGSATHILGFSRELASLGHHVVVIMAQVDPSIPDYEVLDGFEIYGVHVPRLPRMSIAMNFPWLNWTFWPAKLRRMEAIIKRHDIDLLHLHNHMFDMAFAGMSLKRSLGLTVALTLHTVIKHSIRAFNLLLYSADRGFLRHAAVRHADAVIYPGVNIQAYLAEAFGRDDGHFVPYGSSLPDRSGAGVERRIVEQFGLAARRVILSLGHVHTLRNRLVRI